MNSLQPYQIPDAEFPASRPDPLTPEQWRAVNFAYETQPAFILRYAVTGVALIGVVFVLIDIAIAGLNIVAAGASVAGVAVAYVLRALFRTVTSSDATRPDLDPATISRETTTVKQMTVTIVNNITVNQ